MKNPLVVPVLDILQQAEDQLSIAEMLDLLQQPLQSLFETSDHRHLAIYQTNFLIMNALFQLQVELAAQGAFLEVSTLCIQIHGAKAHSANSASAENALADNSANGSLAEFYLDWQNYQATEDEVVSLLNDFWSFYSATDKQEQAMAQLGLTNDADWPSIKSAYQRLAATHHPDKGGDSAQFLAIRQAYEVLRKIHPQT